MNQGILGSGNWPAYLESSSERNLPLYERNGFRVVGEIQALGQGPSIWRMWREPQPAYETEDSMG